MNTIQELDNDKLMTLAPTIWADKPHPDASHLYSFVPTHQVLDHLRDCGWKPVQAGEDKVRKAGRKGFQRHMIRFSKPDLIMNGHRLDLVLYNSHDRGSSFKLIGGIFRFICANGVIVGDKRCEATHRHVGFSGDAFITSADRLSGRMRYIQKSTERWSDIELAPDEQGIFSQAAHSLMYEEPEKAPIPPERLLSIRRYGEEKKRDLWNTFNVVQENVIKGGLRGRNPETFRRTTTRPVKSIERDKKLNQSLWILAEKMAELKMAA